MDIEETINNLIKENRAKTGLGFSRYVLIIGIILGFVTGGLWLFSPIHTQFLVYFGVLAFMSIAAGLFPFFYRRNQARVGALLLCVMLFLAITIAVFSIAEIIPVAGIAYIALIIIGKLLLDENESRWLNVATVAALASILIWGEQISTYWFEPLDETVGVIFNLVVSLGCLVTVIFIISLLVSRQEEQFQQAQRASMELEVMVAEIQAAKAELETAVQDYGNFMTKVAGGDLASRLPLNGDTDSPLVRLGHSLNDMVDDLHQLIGHVQQSANQVASVSQQVNAAADQSGQAGQQVSGGTQQVAEGTAQQTQALTEATQNVEQMARAAEGVARGAQEQAHSVQKTSDLITEMDNIVEHVRQVADAAAEASNRVTGSARDGVAAVEKTGQGMTTIRSRTVKAVEKVKEMNMRSQEIGRIVETIDQIADKTDMLALNAAVEAARAGEHGRGFAVVADQVRKLSEDSKDATQDINILIERVQQSVNQAITAMEGVATEVDNGTQLARQTTQSLEEILQVAEISADQAVQIGGAVRDLQEKSQGVVAAIETVSAVVEENTASAEQVAANSQEVTEAMASVAAIAEENSAATEEVSASAEEMSAQIEEMVASAEELAALAEQLRTTTARFQVDQVEPVQVERVQLEQVAAEQATASSETVNISQEQWDSVLALLERSGNGQSNPTTSHT